MTTVADWIRQRRLERCRRDLLDHPAHFSRVFRSAYGVAPAQYRRLVRPEDAPATKTRIVGGYEP